MDASSKPELAPIYSKRSASFLKLNKVSQALADADACVALRPNWEKAHFRRGTALEEKGDDAGAIAAFEAAEATVTGAGNPEIAKKLHALKKKSKPVPFHLPEAKPLPSAKGTKGTEMRDRGPAGNAAWLATVRGFSEPVAARVAAANAVGGWLAAHLERALKRTPGESEWFFEDPEVRAFLDAGVFEALLDAVTHTVVSIIQAEADAASAARPSAAAAASAGADLAGALLGALHNLLHPSLRAWGTRKQHQALLAAFEQVLRMRGSPLNDARGESVRVDDETKQFTALCAKILNNQGALSVLTGHDTLARARLQLLRALTQRDRGEGKKEDLANRIEESARALVILRRCRFAGTAAAANAERGGGEEIACGAKAAWEPVLDALLTDAGADDIRDEVRVTIEQHALLAGAFPKFGFEGSVGI